MRSNKRRKKEMASNVKSGPPMILVIPLSLVLIAVAGILTYFNSLTAPFVFDDLINILDNPTIRNLKAIRQVFSPPIGSGVGDRPIINFTLALNYAISGEKVWSYHLLNILTHIFAALTLFGIVRRTLVSERMKEAYGHMATPLALGSALIWLLHPIQTQAVTYVIQRCESLMGLFFLLTLYFAIRSWSSTSKTAWCLLSVFSLLLGVGSKEVIVMAPLLVFAYEWIFVHPLLKDIWKRSWPLYSGYGIGVIALVVLVYTGGTSTTGLGTALSTPWFYWWTQPEVILYYLRLVAWPDKLCFDYGWPLASFREGLPSIVIIMVVMAISAWLFFSRKPFGFLAVCFFIILVPTSIMPLPDPAVEYRLYLPLAALSIASVIGIYEFTKVLHKRFSRIKEEHMKPILCAILLISCVIFGYLTYDRNQVYRQGLIWQDTVQKAPRNSRAHLNFGVDLDKTGKPYEAIRHFEETIRLKPDYPEAYTNLGNVLTKLGRLDEAITLYRTAMIIKPSFAPAPASMGIVLTRIGKTDDAIRYLSEAIRLKPDYTEAYSNLGVALGRSGKLTEAIAQFEKALQVRPDYAEAHSNLGLALGRLGRKQEAISHLQEALRLKPDYQAARMNLELLMRMDRY